MPETIELFVHGDDIPEIKIVRVPRTGTLQDVVEAARLQGLPVAVDHADAVVLLEHDGTALDFSRSLEELGLVHHHHLRYRHHHKHEIVTITIKFDATTEQKHLSRGEHPVEAIKHLGGVSQAYDLEEVVAGKLQPLRDDGCVDIKGGEVFIGHVKDSGSS